MKKDLAEALGIKEGEDEKVPGGERQWLNHLIKRVGELKAKPYQLMKWPKCDPVVKERLNLSGCRENTWELVAGTGEPTGGVYFLDVETHPVGDVYYPQLGVLVQGKSVWLWHKIENYNQQTMGELPVPDGSIIVHWTGYDREYFDQKGANPDVRVLTEGVDLSGALNSRSVFSFDAASVYRTRWIAPTKIKKTKDITSLDLGATLKQAVRRYLGIDIAVQKDTELDAWKEGGWQNFDLNRLTDYCYADVVYMAQVFPHLEKVWREQVPNLPLQSFLVLGSPRLYFPNYQAWLERVSKFADDTLWGLLSKLSHKGGFPVTSLKGKNIPFVLGMQLDGETISARHIKPEGYKNPILAYGVGKGAEWKFLLNDEGKPCTYLLSKKWLKAIDTGNLTCIYPEVLKVIRAHGYWVACEKRFNNLKIGCDWWSPPINPIGTITGRATESVSLVVSKPKKSHLLGSSFFTNFETPKGRKVFRMDMPQQEARLAALLTAAWLFDMGNPDPWGNAFVRMTLGNKEDGTDIHSQMAKRAGVSRDVAKSAVFASIFGAGYNRLLSTLGISAEKCRDLYEALKPVLNPVKEAIMHRSTKICQTPLGRKQPVLFSTFKDGEGYTTLGNWPVQTTGSDMIQIVAAWLLHLGYDILLYIHDEVWLNVPDTTDINELAATCKAIYALTVSEIVQPLFGRFAGSVPDAFFDGGDLEDLTEVLSDHSYESGNIDV